MNTTSQLISIRSHKLGALIYDARSHARRQPEECAEVMSVTPAQYAAYEKGGEAPSLPELEALAYYLEIPLEQFWSSTSLLEKAANLPVQPQRFFKLRNRIIGATLRMARSRANLTYKDMEEKTSIPENQLKTYELGEVAIPLPELELLASALEIPIEQFYDNSGQIGKWRSNQQAVKKMLELPPDLQGFLCEPVNRPYLELAMRLSELSVERLRAIAEGLLEITF